ncbi:MAG: universal stress protein [Bacteroidetes bacterium]|nr:universal stress protein [Bacteroidota bacterium]
MQKILVPIDFSSYSYYALGVAANIAKKANAEIHLLHIVEAPATESDHEINMKFLEITELKSMSGIKLIHAVKMESIADGINIYASKNKMELIVMGSHGHRTTHDHIYGSNTDKVLKTATLPLLIVKESTPDFSINTLVFASNFYSEANLSFNKVKVLLDLYHPEVHLLKVLSGDFETPEYSARLMKDFASYNNLKTYFCKTVQAKSVEEGINIYCDEANPELLMIETHGHSQLSHLLFGSVSEDVATHRKQPVLTIRIDEPVSKKDVIFPA